MLTMDHPPLALLSEYNRAYPRGWREINRLREGRGKDLPWWPDWCFVPIAGAIAIVTEGASMPLSSEAQMRLVEYPPAIMAALAGWRMTKGIYRFEPTLLEELAAMPLEGKLPTEIFYSLPEWAIYIETPGMTFPPFGEGELQGFFIHLEYDVNDGRSELRFALCMDNDGVKKQYYIPLHLGKWDMTEAINRVYEVPNLTELTEGIAESLTPLVNLVLYICSANADYEKPVHPSRLMSGKKKKKYAAAIQHKTWDIGVRLGPALRKARTVIDVEETEEGEESEIRTSPRPHWRRGHWHHFWTGPRSEPEKRKLVLRWLPPIPVGIPGVDTPAVVRKVKK